METLNTEFSELQLDPKNTNNKKRKSKSKSDRYNIYFEDGDVSYRIKGKTTFAELIESELFKEDLSRVQLDIESEKKVYITRHRGDKTVWLLPNVASSISNLFSIFSDNGILSIKIANFGDVGLFRVVED